MSYGKAKSGKTGAVAAPYALQGKKSDDDQQARMVYVGGLPWKAKWQELKDHMSQAGTIEFVQVLTEDGTQWGRSRGTGYVRYSTIAEAQGAIAMLNGSELMGRALKVDQWTGGAGGAGGGGGKGKGGSWGWGGFGGFGSWGGRGVMKVNDHGNPLAIVYVGGLPWTTKWQDLKDLMSKVGTVEFAKILTEDGSDWGRSKGIGCVRFSSAAEATQAINMFNGSQLDGRTLTVGIWTKKNM